MDPLVITATPNVSWLHPEIDYPRTPEEIAAEARRCRDAGAAVLHVHAEGRWRSVIEALRAETDLIVQCGMSSLPIPERLGWPGVAEAAELAAAVGRPLATPADARALLGVEAGAS